MKALVDTSVLSLALRRRDRIDNATTRKLKRLLDADAACLIGPIRQELLSGIRVVEQFEALRSELRAIPDLPLVLEDFESAALFSNLCRGKGVQGSPVDFLICAVCSRLAIPIFTTDKDFDHYCRLLPVTRY